MAPHVSRRRVGETWAAKYRAERGVRASATPTGGTSLSHTPMGCCVPHGGPVRMTYTLYARRIRLRAAHGRVAVAPWVTCSAVRRVSVAELSQGYNSHYVHRKNEIYLRQISVVTS